MTNSRPPYRLTLCLAFDGVLHSYRSPWDGAANIPDPPVTGAFMALARYVEVFHVVIYSSRSSDPAGLAAMQNWLEHHAYLELHDDLARTVIESVRFAYTKPPAHLTLDDRAWTFNGVFPQPADISAFKPWNRR